ncbi:DUF1376 domain-containing protein [Sulfitobacter phage pCB2047-C]|uniref:primosomal protein n=1 Tax=Sulfitobacter phage pCB2047-C TaxID=754043 RepID=UPI0002C0B12A|nr:primosomal protein [Sulfitobacter phage pCB2047-C]AGG91225.1 DUF1376 domain-containing protein [Sulfitobacter phage pCB2047-C]
MSIVHIPFYPSDWLAGTAALSDAEKGVYITLVARMYEMAGPIERDDNRLYRVCGSKSKASFVKALNYLISEGKIIETPDGLINEKAAKVIEQTTEKSTKAKAAAQSRWDRKPNKNNGGSDANASAEHMPQQCQPEPKPYKEVTSVTSKGDLPSKHLGFDEFWKVVPNKLAKQAALKAWGKLSIEDKRAAYSAAKAGWLSDWQRRYPDANPLHPASFLNGKRWEDQPAQPKLKAIDGGHHGERTSKSESRQHAFVSGAAGAS